MELTKTVTSRKGNIYKFYLDVNDKGGYYFKAENTKGEIAMQGSGSFRKNDSDYLVKFVRDMTLCIEESYTDFTALQIFEEWDGVIK